jgi:hypothetical protein
MATFFGFFSFFGFASFASLTSEDISTLISRVEDFQRQQASESKDKNRCAWVFAALSFRFVICEKVSSTDGRRRRLAAAQKFSSILEV